jgi:hypothetical protein
MNDKPNDVIASKASEEYLDCAWALLDERVVTDAAGTVDIIAELMMERDNLKSQINEYRINRHANVESTTNASMEFSAPSDQRVKLLTPVPASPDELTVVVLGNVHTGKSILSVLIGRLLAQIGVPSKVVDEDGVLSPFYTELSTPDMAAVFNGDLVGRKGKDITITNKTVRRNIKLDPRFEPPVDKPIPVGAIINLPESPEIALGEIIQLRNT